MAITHFVAELAKDSEKVPKSIISFFLYITSCDSVVGN